MAYDSLWEFCLIALSLSWKKGKTKLLVCPFDTTRLRTCFMPVSVPGVRGTAAGICLYLFVFKRFKNPCVLKWHGVGKLGRKEVCAYCWRQLGIRWHFFLWITSESFKDTASLQDVGVVSSGGGGFLVWGSSDNDVLFPFVLSWPYWDLKLWGQMEDYRLTPVLNDWWAEKSSGKSHLYNAWTLAGEFSKRSSRFSYW